MVMWGATHASFSGETGGKDFLDGKLSLLEMIFLMKVGCCLQS